MDAKRCLLFVLKDGIGPGDIKAEAINQAMALLQAAGVFLVHGSLASEEGRNVAGLQVDA